MSTNKGLNNMGNTCYLNAGLQMILQNKDFCSTILENHNKSENLQVMSNFIKEYYTSPQKSVTPMEIKRLVSKKKGIMMGNKQEDSYEFMIFLLDILNDDLKGELNTIFEIKSETTIKCKIKKCLTISRSIGKNNYLILPIDSNDNDLDDCYRNYKSHEKLEGNEMYYCDNCKEKRIASKRVGVIDWSKHLIIVLNRYVNNGSNLRKNNKEIKIPIDWRHDFTIKGAVIHSGGMGGGHYVFIGRDIKTNVWTMYDDSSTSSIRPEQVQNYLNRAYIFHYQNINI
jgi:hypothetical protein